jgi:hypothetical protein
VAKAEGKPSGAANSAALAAESEKEKVRKITFLQTANGEHDVF